MPQNRETRENFPTLCRYLYILYRLGNITATIGAKGNNPLAGKMPVITSSNKLRTYTTARYYTDDEILVQITKGGK